METFAPFIGLAALIIGLITWLRTDLRKVENSVSELSNRLDAQGKEMRAADEASEQRLRDAITAQGKEMRETITAQGKEMREADEASEQRLRDAITAQGKEMRETITAQSKESRDRTDGLAKDVAELQAGVSVIKARLDQPLFVKVIRDELEDAA